MRKILSSVTLALILISTLTVAFSIQPVKAADGTIYIRADGSIDPPTAPIRRDARAFMEEEAKKLDGEDVYLQTTETFENAVRKFEKYLPQISQQVISDPKDEEKAEFIALIKILSDTIKEAHEYESAPLKNAFKKLGLIKA